jgi:undecaprenyl-diphosphatase
MPLQPSVTDTLRAETIHAGLTLVDAVVLGLVEGITEYLPISSTGHLILASSLLGADRRVPELALEDFEIVIQGGAILAVVTLYWPSVVRMIKGLLGKDNGGFSLFLNLLIAFIPSAAIGKLMEDQIHAHFFNPLSVLAALFIGGVYMLIVAAWQRGKIGTFRSSLAGTQIEHITPRQALVIGLLQCVALIPGTSRALMTITGGLFVGLKPRQAAEFSFLLGLPTLTAATLYKLAKNFAHASSTGEPNLFQQLGTAPCLIACLTAAIAAIVAVRWLVGFVSRWGLSPFGWYRIVLTMVLIILFEANVVHIGPDQSSRLNNQTEFVPGPVEMKPAT